ncbi:MAG: polysaccharide biosynthesis protein [Flavobacteriales bacterium]|nr:polysaccharide biosynthesis protein [Flavobacteriales bacterium]MBT7619988.1 polysaccharide biosynthesis protein [Flavobacteriales bacterium]
MKNRLLTLDRFYKQIITLSFDVVILIFSLWLAFFLQSDDFISKHIITNWWLIIVVPIIAIPLFIKTGLYRSVLQYTGVKVITTSFQSITITCIIVTFIHYYGRGYFLEINHVLPRSIIIMFWFISNTFIITSRFLLKGMIYSWDTRINKRKQTLIYGAGNAGIQLVESLTKSIDYAPVAFIDDDKQKQGTIINYLQIFSFDNIDRVLKKYDVKLILLAIPSASQKRRVEILKKLSKFPLEVKVLPSLDNIVNGEVTIDSIKHVQVEDILGRDAVDPKENLLKKNIKGKNILITGAGGSIGSELCRQILNLSPKKIVLFENSEFNLYSIHQELLQSRKRSEIIPKLATVTNLYQINKVISENQINTIFHAAAYKHVPMVEMNISEGVYNNVIGTYNVAKAAIENKVENMLLISTDKAVRPTNVMGASKRFSELVLQAFSDKNSYTCFSMVRFGNVLDSAGSVVPLFRKQIKEGGPVTVTHRNITRYFMSIPEAVQLVLQAGAMAKGGDVFVLDMGDPIKILDLAYRMIHLSGLKPIDTENPNGDIKIKFTGLRPGEKLYEELLIGDDVIQSEHPRIMQAREEKLTLDIIEKKVLEISNFRENQDDLAIKNILLKNVNGYHSQEE